MKLAHDTHSLLPVKEELTAKTVLSGMKFSEMVCLPVALVQPSSSLLQRNSKTNSQGIRCK